MPRLRVGVLISGRGSNLQALIDAAAEPSYPAEIVTVISNHAGAQGLQRAEAAGIPRHVIADPDRAAFADAADGVLRDAQVELVALAGFMRILDTGFVERWDDRMINVHPSLLPSFPGLHPQRQALAAGVKFSGCTVHFVRVAVDTGPIIAQAAVPVEDGDDEDRLAARILAAEHRLYPLAVRLLAEGRLSISGNRVAVMGSTAPLTVLLNPTD
jgi:phosphoribosylglycinamide formyltransferase 1